MPPPPCAALRFLLHSPVGDSVAHAPHHTQHVYLFSVSVPCPVPPRFLPIPTLGLPAQPVSSCLFQPSLHSFIGSMRRVAPCLLCHVPRPFPSDANTLVPKPLHTIPYTFEPFRSQAPLPLCHILSDTPPMFKHQCTTASRKLCLFCCQRGTPPCPPQASGLFIRDARPSHVQPGQM